MKYLLILLSLCLTFSVNADISKVPRKDLNDIQFLFENLVLENDFAYTIFGSKPMSLADMCLKIPPDLSIHKHLKARFLLAKYKRSLNAWYKYKNEFYFKDFIFLDKEEDLFDCLVLVLINKKNLLTTLYNHESIFKQELGESFTPESFLEKLEKREISLAKAIHNNNRLLGIMLGYGERNATLFQERFDLMKSTAKKKKEGLSLDEETKKLNTLEAQLGDFSEFEEDPVIPPLYFLADVSHPETIELKKTYETDRQNIEKLMKKPNFMANVLERLLDSQSCRND